jgi:hypothetical protein
MMFACLGWGSLIWNPGDLPLRGEWCADGPALPIEFARKSNNGRITLVIAEGANPIDVLWCEMNAPSVEAARKALADREGISRKNAERLIGTWTNDTATDGSIARWARSKGFDAVLWTGLGPSFPGVRGTPPCDQIIDYLAKLEGKTKQQAEEYIRRAPAQIRTAYRARIEQELGWTPVA